MIIFRKYLAVLPVFALAALIASSNTASAAPNGEVPKIVNFTNGIATDSTGVKWRAKKDPNGGWVRKDGKIFLERITAPVAAPPSPKQQTASAVKSRLSHNDGGSVAYVERGIYNPNVVTARRGGVTLLGNGTRVTPEVFRAHIDQMKVLSDSTGGRMSENCFGDLNSQTINALKAVHDMRGRSASDTAFEHADLGSLKGPARVAALQGILDRADKEDVTFENINKLLLAHNRKCVTEAQQGSVSQAASPEDFTMNLNPADAGTVAVEQGAAEAALSAGQAADDINAN